MATLLFASKSRYNQFFAGAADSKSSITSLSAEKNVSHILVEKQSLMQTVHLNACSCAN